MFRSFLAGLTSQTMDGERGLAGACHVRHMYIFPLCAAPVPHTARASERVSAFTIRIPIRWTGAIVETDRPSASGRRLGPRRRSPEFTSRQNFRVVVMTTRQPPKRCARYLTSSAPVQERGKVEKNAITVVDEPKPDVLILRMGLQGHEANGFQGNREAEKSDGSRRSSARGCDDPPNGRVEIELAAP